MKFWVEMKSKDFQFWKRFFLSTGKNNIKKLILIYVDLKILKSGNETSLHSQSNQIAKNRMTHDAKDFVPYQRIESKCTVLNSEINGICLCGRPVYRKPLRKKHTQTLKIDFSNIDTWLPNYSPLINRWTFQ